MQKFVSAAHSLLSTAARPLKSKIKLSSRTRHGNDGAPPLDDVALVTSLSVLPSDVLLLILGLLDARSLFTCKQISHLFRTLIDTDMLLTYRLELATNGMVDGPASSSLTLPERLEKLRQFSERSCAGRFTHDTEMKQHARVGMGEFTHLMTPWNFRPVQADSFGGTVSFQLAEGQSLMVYAPPSFVEGTPARHWTIPLSPVGKRVIAVDITQDLVVALVPAPAGTPGEGELSLFSLESGGSAFHPLAQEPTWEMPSDVVATQIFGPYVAWQTPYRSTGTFEDHLQVRDWQTGRTVWEADMRNISSYAFVDASHLIVAFNGAPDGSGHRPDTIGIYRIRGHRQRPASHVATLQLPRGLELSMMLNSSVPCPPTPPPSALFWPDPEQRIVVLRLRTPRYPAAPNALVGMLRASLQSTSNWIWHYALLIIPCATFHEHIKLARGARVLDSTRISEPEAVAWEDWGPRGSVLIREENFEKPHLLRTGHWLPPKFVFPYGSHLTFFIRSSEAEDGDACPITLDVNPLAKLHRPHPGCTRRGVLPCVEKSKDVGLSSLLKTAYPRAYYSGPPFWDVEQAFGVSQNGSGYVVLRRDEGPDGSLEGFSAFTVV